MYTWEARTSTLAQKAVSEGVSTRGQITTVAISADGGYIAAGDVRLHSSLLVCVLMIDTTVRRKDRPFRW